MSNYVGFFVRDNLGQQPNQQGTSWSSSPDIIFYGTQPQQNMSAFTSTAGYATDYGSNVYLNTPNFVYLRALNTNPAATSSAPITGRAWFFYTESDLALWPTNWKFDNMTVAGNSQNYMDIVTTANNQVVVGGQPVIWTPNPPASGTHYCGISWIENVPVNPPTNPVVGFGYMGTFDQLVNFVLSNPNMGWRNTTEVAGLGLTWSQTTNITGPSTPGQFNIGVQCTNMPTDGKLGWYMPPPAGGGSGASLPLAPIPSPNYEGSVKILDWPGGAQSSITVEYQQGATAPPKGSNIVVTLTTPYSSLSADTQYRVDKEGAMLMRTTSTYHEFDAFGRPIIMITPTQVVQVGTQTYTY